MCPRSASRASSSPDLLNPLPAARRRLALVARANGRRRETAMDEHSETAAEPAAPHHQSFWLWVMCLTGVDYFSTLGYQPSIAYDSAGLLAPLATIVLVAVTLFGALPLYWYVCGRSHEGQGSIGMLAKLVSGWPGKIMVLI